MDVPSGQARPKAAAALVQVELTLATRGESGEKHEKQSSVSSPDDVEEESATRQSQEQNQDKLRNKIVAEKRERKMKKTPTSRYRMREP